MASCCLSIEVVGDENHLPQRTCSILPTDNMSVVKLPCDDDDPPEDENVVNLDDKGTLNDSKTMQRIRSTTTRVVVTESTTVPPNVSPPPQRSNRANSDRTMRRIRREAGHNSGRMTRGGRR